MPWSRTRSRSTSRPRTFNGTSAVPIRDHYLLFEEQAAQILGMTDAIAERVRKNGACTLRSIGHVARMQRLRDNDHELVAPPQMLGELTVDNAALARSLEEAHELCEQQRDLATASLIEGWIDEAQNRVWFLRETSQTFGVLSSAVNKASSSASWLITDVRQDPGILPLWPGTALRAYC